MNKYKLATILSPLSNDRIRKIVLTTGFSGLGRIIKSLTFLISVPLSLQYLGVERFGLWMTVTSVITLLGFTDLGMGNGLVNAIAAAKGHNDNTEARQSVSSTFYFIVVISLLILLIFSFIYPIVPWSKFFGVTTPQGISEAGPTVFIFVFCFFLNLPFSLVQRIQTGFQEGYIAASWQSVESLLSLAGLLFAIYMKFSLPMLVVATFGTTIFVSIVSFLIEFRYRRPWLIPNHSCISWKAGKKILECGLLFFILQALYLIGVSTDNLIIANFSGATAVTPYSVTQRLFTALQIFNFVAYALWPAMGEAIAQRDYKWALSSIKRSLLISMCLSFLTVIPMLIFGHKIIEIWAGQEAVPPFPLLAGFAGWFFVSSYGAALFPLLNSDKFYLKKQVLLHLLAAGIAFPLKIFLGRFCDNSMLIWSTVCCYSVFFLFPATRLVFGNLGRMANPRKLR